MIQFCVFMFGFVSNLSLVIFFFFFFFLMDNNGLYWIAGLFFELIFLRFFCVFFHPFIFALI